MSARRKVFSLWTLPLWLVAAIAFFWIPWVLWCWCVPPSRSEIPGTYVCDYGYGVETLTIGADGTYRQRFAAKTGGISTNSGTWNFGYNGAVDLNNPMLVADGFGDLNKDLAAVDGLWTLNPERSPFSGKISFTIDEADHEFK
jgi:hypothetical protein